MSFTSFAFLLFFLAVLLCYYFSTSGIRKYILLFASYLFYMSWKAAYVFILLFTTAVDYFCGLALEKTSNSLTRRTLVFISIATNLAVLFSFRYADTLLPGLQDWLHIHKLSPSWEYTHVLIPIGISFYTFQSISYILDIYYGRMKAEKDPVIFAAFVSYFPQLLAGPIDKSYHLIPQLKKESDFDWYLFASGIKLVIWGLFKKMVVADNLAPFVTKLFLPEYPVSAWDVVFMTCVFTIQIYADFSGYSDIAIGTSNMLGIRLKTNFKQPYFAVSIQDYWKKWHISLTDWFRDYVFSYISISLRNSGRLAIVIGIMSTFILSGLWHGSTLNFIIWGSLHGIYLSLFFLLNKKIYISRLWMGKGIVISYLLTMIAVLFANVFFRSATTPQAFHLLRTFATVSFADLAAYNWMALPKIGLLFSLLMFVIDFKLKDLPATHYFNTGNAYIRNATLAFMLISVLVFGQYNGAEFIYFKF